MGSLNVTGLNMSSKSPAIQTRSKLGVPVRQLCPAMRSFTPCQALVPERAQTHFQVNESRPRPRACTVKSWFYHLPRFSSLCRRPGTCVRLHVVLIYYRSECVNRSLGRRCCFHLRGRIFLRGRLSDRV